MLVADLRLGFGRFLLGLQLYGGVLLTEGCCWEVLGGVGGGDDGAGVTGCCSAYEQKTIHTSVVYEMARALPTWGAGPAS